MTKDINEMPHNGYYKLEVYSKKSFNKILRINASQVLSIYSHALTLKEWQDYKRESFSAFHIKDTLLKGLHIGETLLNDILDERITYHKIINVRDTYEFYSHTYSSVFFESLSQCLDDIIKVEVDNG